MKTKTPYNFLPIDHSKIIDGFAEMQEHINYRPFESFCGICDAAMTVTPIIQKHLLETKRVPVKMLRRGGIFCGNCAQLKAEINKLRKGNKFLEIENGKALLQKLEQKETIIRSLSKSNYHGADWPY